MRKTPVFKVNPKRPQKERVRAAARLVRAGGLVAFPTETVYGIAANLYDANAIGRLRGVKGRPAAKPFTVHIADMKTVGMMGCSVSKNVGRLLKRYWPGPLTVILKSRGGKKIGFRMPDNRIALDLIRQARVPVVAPSANLSGKPPPRSAPEVLVDLDGEIDLVIDGGKAKVGVESTVVDMTGRRPKVLREGAIKKEEIFRILNPDG